MSSGFRLEPVGTVRSRFKDPADLPPPAFAPPRFFERSTGQIEIRPEYAAGLDGLEGFSHIIVLFQFHRAGPAKLRVTPPGQTESRGVFATRSPHRPNPLGMSVLRLLGRAGRILEVSGLDIKPYTSRDRKSHIRTGWLRNKRRPAR
jgi:tRNA-Thr(GGU) m(6)t(6)A37 methyltransferase TsaA